MQDKPLVSIVIPVYNGANFLRQAIDSALAQTYTNCEIIVVNDGSTDEGATDAIARSYGSKIRYFIKTNGGVATAVNYGIQQMHGEYFSWLSHDDMYNPPKIERQMEAILNASNNVEIAHSNFSFLYMETGQIDPVDWLKCYSKEEMEYSNFAPLFLCIHGSTILVKKSCFERVGLYDTGLPATQDSEFLFRAMRGRRSVFLEDNLVTVRMHDQQGQRIMSAFPKEYNEIFQRFCKMLDDAEKIEMCGSVYNFYYRLYLTLKTFRTASSVLGYLQKCMMEHQSERKNVKVLNKISIFSNYNKIYLFGAGMYGRQLALDFRMHSISIDGFIDNNSEKQGKNIDGILCLPLSDILPAGDKVMVIVSMLSSETVIHQLHKYAVKHIWTYRQCREQLAAVEPDI
ncbi:glycosyltransferase [Pectinatus frisingensis]|uniref:glycosyltransferase n=1 Tax=Pectinatus frisingensis TaxID=865 RepID=UPI0018C6920E|nr:glycosyltransferase [Pectinatus frisingensis]